MSIVAAIEQEYRKQLEVDLKDPNYGEKYRQRRREEREIHQMEIELYNRRTNQAYDKMRSVFLKED